jgi:uncharacterized pyridoxamine 5'-phosphate oxidase family protein
MATGPRATDVDPEFSAAGAAPMAWADALAQLELARTYWISTVRPDGRPHVTTIAAIVLDGTVYFATGPQERKARNLAANPHVAITTGSSAFEGVDIVLEGEAVAVTDVPTLERLADAYTSNYPGVFGFRVKNDVFTDEGGDKAIGVYAVRATKGFGFRKGSGSSQTRWRF